MKSTSIHEAGHAVAQIRRGFELYLVTIVPSEGTLGRILGEGESHVNDAATAADMVLCYLAGWAAVAHFFGDEAKAMDGADSDFDIASEMIAFWEIKPLEEHKRNALEFMGKPENRRAVEMLANELLKRQRIDGDLAGVIIELADGNITEAEYARYLASRNF